LDRGRSRPEGTVQDRPVELKARLGDGGEDAGVVDDPARHAKAPGHRGGGGGGVTAPLTGGGRTDVGGGEWLWVTE